MPTLTHIPYIHMRLCRPASLACQTLTYDPKEFETHSNGSKTLKPLQNVIKRFPPPTKKGKRKEGQVYAYVHAIPYHAIWDYSYHAPYTPQKSYVWDSHGNLYQVLHVLHLQDAYVLHATSTSGICICQLRLENCKIRSLGHSCFQSFRELLITWRWKLPNRSQTPQTLQWRWNTIKKSKNWSSQPMKQVT